MSESRQKFDKAISMINREGIKELVSWLENETDFFTAPASCNNHGNYDGGLLDHTINVLEFALTNFNFLVRKNPENEKLKESVIITALCHDVCKTNQYLKEEKWTKDSNNKWKSYLGYSIDDKFPLGHGEKSVYLVSKFIKLTDDEALAVRFHMGPYEVGTVIPGMIQTSYNKVFEICPLAVLIHSADIMATTIETKIDYKAEASK